MTSLVAGLATGIFASYHFGRIAPYGLLGNLAAMPVVSLLVMPLAIVSVIAMPFGFHVVVLKAMTWSVGIVIAIADYVAGLSPAALTGQMPVAALLLFTLALVTACLFYTWLRFAAVPAVFAGVLVWQTSEPPVAFISKDGRQFAVLDRRDGSNDLHVNRSRPNAFTVDQWLAAAGTATIIKPAVSDAMRCDADICTATFDSGDEPLRIAYVLELPGRLSVLCADYDLVILAKAPSPSKCLNGTTLIAARQLALNGAAEIRFGNDLIDVRHALPGPVRPWLDHRKYSRAARNLEDRKPRGSIKKP